jgi:hypothetical protein
VKTSGTVQASIANAATIVGTVIDAATGTSVPARVYVTGSDGKSYFDTSGIVYANAEEQHFVVDGNFTVTVPAGTINILVERGPEFLPASVTIDAPPNESVLVDIPVERWINMSAEGWYSADLHVHRDPGAIGLSLLAEDLNLVPLLTTHALKNLGFTRVWGDESPSHWLVRVDDTHVYSVFDHELERLGPNMFGSVLFFGLTEPFPAEPELGPLWPTDALYIEKARAQGAHIDGERPSWRGTPENVALGLIDSIGIVGNQLHRQHVQTEAGMWGMLPSEAPGTTPGRHFNLGIMEAYYRLLNCGFRLPVSAGTASGVMPSPIGYSRVYAKLEEPFSYENWFAALRAGRSFATNGPMMRFAVEGQGAGAELSFSGKHGEVEVSVEAVSRAPLEKIELVLNGEIIGTASGDGRRTELQLKERVALDRSGWIAARAFELCSFTERCAHTSPVYVVVDGQAVADRKAAEYFLGVMDETIAYARIALEFDDESQRSCALETHELARAVFARIVEQS